MTVQVHSVESDAGWDAAREIRTRVFIEEQDCPPDEEWDGHDATSRHVLARVREETADDGEAGEKEGRAVGTARWRVVPHGERLVAKLERFAVLPDARGHGVGGALVHAVLDDARKAGFSVFLLHAQAHLEDWYAEFGFTSTGKTFTEVGIPHVEMILDAS